MQLSILQENFAHALSIVNRAVNAKGTLPVLANVLLRAEDGKFTVSAANLEIGIIHTAAAQIKKEGGITIPARQLIDYVNALPPDRIDLELNAKTQTLHLKCARHDANIKGVDWNEFPIIPTFEKQDHALIEPDILKGVIARARISAAQDDSRPVLKNILATFKGQNATLVTADGFRLTVTCAHLERGFNQAKGKNPAAALIPDSALKELSALLGKMEEPVAIAFSQTGAQVMFDLGDTLFVANLAEGNFPDFNQIVPKSHSTRVICNVHELTQSVKAAMVFARDANSIIRLKFHEQMGGICSIFGQSAETGDAAAILDAQRDGDELEIAFNGKFMLDALGVINSPQVAFELTEAAAPGVVKPVGSDDFVHVLMPMHIKTMNAPIS